MERAAGFSRVIHTAGMVRAQVDHPAGPPKPDRPGLKLQPDAAVETFQFLLILHDQASISLTGRHM